MSKTGVAQDPIDGSGVVGDMLKNYDQGGWF
jgi:hypothetical protein